MWNDIIMFDESMTWSYLVNVRLFEAINAQEGKRQTKRRWCVGRASEAQSYAAPAQATEKPERKEAYINNIAADWLI